MPDYSEATQMATEFAMEAADGEGDGPPPNAWHRGVAFTTLLLAVLAALATLLSGMTSHELLVDRTEEIVQVATAETDLVEAEVLRSRVELRETVGLPVPPGSEERIAELEAEAEAAARTAAELRDASFNVGSQHLVFAVAAALFAVAIAVTGMAVIVDQRWLWVVGGGIGVVGLVVMGWAFRARVLTRQLPSGGIENRSRTSSSGSGASSK